MSFLSRKEMSTGSTTEEVTAVKFGYKQKKRHHLL
jgi:hypothetical protein